MKQEKLYSRSVLSSSLLLTSMLSGILAFADTLSCSAPYFSPSQYVNGNCNNGRCSGYVPGESNSVSGACSGTDVTFSATANETSEYITGQCVNGRFSAYVDGSTLSWWGSCSDGGQFSATTFEDTQYLSGSCSENGFFSAYVPGSSGEVFGYCTSYDE